MSYGYRVQNEYTSFPFLTRIAGTYSFLVTLGIIFGKVSPNSLTYDESAIAAGEWWRYLTAHLFFGMHQARFGAIVRYIIVGINFLRYFYYMENYFFFRRKFEFITMIGIFLLAANAFASFNAVVGFYGDVLRMAIITAWSQIYYQDKFSVVAGLNLTRFNARKLPLVWLAFFSFIDYPLSIAPISPVPHMLFGIVVGYLYSLAAFRFGLVPEQLTRRREPIIHELIHPGEMFVYIVISVLQGGKMV